MRKILLFFILVFLWVSNIKSQSCVPTNINGTIINLACGQACTSFVYHVPHLRSTTDYLDGTIPFSPLPYVVAGGSEDPNLYDDDTYSFLISLPFPFCFYGTNYNGVVVGSNGLLTFDATNASCANAYTISPPIPSNGGAGPQCSQGGNYYPKAAIMGAYYDFDPRPGPTFPTYFASPPEHKIQWRIEGTAPCRKFVVSYYHIGVYDGNGSGTSCGFTNPNTLQIVIYESTGLIDVFIENKTCTSSTNTNKGILGIQDFTRTLYRASPGKNATSWNSQNEGYRFTPNGGASNFVSAQLFTLGGVFVANGDTSTTTPGILDITFPSICPPNVPSTPYVVRTIFNSCTGPQLISNDTITFNRITSLPATITTNPTTCGTSTGSITVTPTAGTSPYTYTLNGGAPVTVPGAYTFSGLAAGLYTIVVTDANGCTNTFMVTVTTNSTIPGTATTTATSCPLSTDGTITVTPTGGTPPYSYSLDGGPSQLSNIFLNVPPGTHTVVFTDAMGCTGSVTVTVAAGSTPLTATITTTPTSCPTVNNGTITVTPTSGTPAYQYSLDGGPFQPGNVFNNLAAGAHTVMVKDLFGCTGTFPVNVVMGSGLTSTIAFSNPPCNNVNDGTITITPTSGTPPFQYSLNGGPNQPTNIFSGLAPGLYTINFTDALGCTGNNSVTLTTNPPITATSTNTMPLCNGASNGTLTINASGGMPPYKYSIDGGVTFQVSAVFNGLSAGNYNIIVKDSLGCVYIFTFSLSEPPFLTVSAPTIASTCNGNDGTITVTAAGGTAPYQYSINNGLNYQSANIFIVAPGVYDSIVVRDTNNCIANTTAVVAISDTMRLVIGPDSTICVGKSVTFAPQTNAQTNIFKWTATPTLLQSEIDKDSIANATVTPPFTKKYYLRAKWGVCQRVDSIVINVLNKPIAFAGKDTTICPRTPAYLNGSASNISGPVLYTWAPITPLLTFVSPDSSQAVALPDSTQEYIFNVRDNYGCNFSVFDTMKVFIDPPVPAFAGNDTNAVLGQPHQLFATGGVSYMWSPSVNLDNPFAQNPRATLFNDTYFRVTVTDAVGCSGFDDVFVKVYEGPTYYVPNAFSPNKDGLNELFRPIPVGMAQTDYFLVFDRYGALVFQTNQWLKGWDGTIKGKDALMGTYVWMVKGRDKFGKVVQMKGTVLLMR